MTVPTSADPGTTGVVAAINRTWFGAGLAPETQARLADLAEIRRVPAGAEIVREGELCRELGIVMSGRIALRMLVPERGMVTIQTVEPGDLVAWSALVPPHRAMSTVMATEPAELLFLDGERLRAAMHADHALAASVYPRILQVVSRRLEATRLQLLDLFARDRREGAGEVAPW